VQGLIIIVLMQGTHFEFDDFEAVQHS